MWTMIRISVPLDGSPNAEAAIRHAAAISRTFSAEIELISIIEGSGAESVTRPDSVDWQLRKRQKQLYLSRLAESLREKGMKVNWLLREGDAAQEIVRHINEADIDLLVLTRYGAGEAEQFSGGGTAQKVISASAASILLIDPACKFDDELGYKRILVVVDGSQRSEWASSFAAMAAQTFDGSLHLLQIVEESRLPGNTPAAGDTRRLIDQINRAARSQANFQLSHLTSRFAENTEVTGTVIVSDNIPMAIESVATADQTDLLVVAAQSAQDGDADRYGHVCESLLAHVHRPVLVLRSEAAGLATSRFRSVYLDESRADAG
jgi:nucleotide-binding universal stress UspA family protein